MDNWGGNRWWEERESLTREFISLKGGYKKKIKTGWNRLLVKVVPMNKEVRVGPPN